VSHVAAQPPLTLNLQVTPESCPGTADGAILAIPAGGSGNYSYLWSTGDQVALLSGLTAGTYAVTVTDTQGASATASATVGVNGPALIAEAGQDTLVCSNSLLLTGITGGGGVGQWVNVNSAGTLLTPSSAQSLVVNMQAGINQFAWVVTGGQCTNSDTISVIVSAATQVDAGEDTLLCGTTIALSGSQPGTGNGIWSNSGSPLTFQNPGQAQTTASGLVPGNSYTVFWTVTEGNCTGMDSMQIEALVPPTANFSFNGSGLLVGFSDNSTFANTWVWDFGDGATDAVPNPSHAYAQSGNYVVCLTVFNTCGADTLCRELTLQLLSSPEPEGAHTTLSPSPAQTHAWLQLKNWPDPTATISLWSLDGRQLFQETRTLTQGSLSMEIKLAGLEGGMYLVKVDSQAGMEVRRIWVNP
jgi:hypothetical protein